MIFSSIFTEKLERGWCRKMSDIIEKLKKKAEETPTFLSVTDIPNQVEARILTGEFKTDKRGNECFFLRLITKDNKIIVQKYTPSTYRDLYNAMKEAGDVEYLMNNFHVWEKRRSGRAINERLFPVPAKKVAKK